MNQRQKIDEKKFPKWLFKQGKKWISNSNLRHVDRTTRIFVTLLEDLKETDLAEKLYKYYEETV